MMMGCLSEADLVAVITAILLSQGWFEHRDLGQYGIRAEIVNDAVITAVAILHAAKHPELLP
jgi:hypothetical protein